MSNNKKPPKRDEPNPSIRTLALISLVAIVIQFLGGIFIYYSIDNWGDRSSFGDMFGAIGTLFSGLAFAGVIYTILLQREELKDAAKSQQRLEQSLTEQSKALTETARLNSLSFFPSLNCRIQYDDSGLFFLIQNPSNLPAFFVDAWVIGIYDEDDVDIPTFLVKHVSKKEYREMKLNSTDEGFYGVYDRFFFPNFPQKQQNSIRVEFPSPPISFRALLQFSDVKGTNYHQLYWFFSEDNKKYRLGSLSPIVPIMWPIIEYKGKLDFKGLDNVPNYLTEFASFYNCSIPNSYINTEKYLDVEDRGEWKSI